MSSKQSIGHHISYNARNLSAFTNWFSFVIFKIDLILQFYPTDMSLTSTQGEVTSNIEAHVGILNFGIRHSPPFEPKEIEFSLPLGIVEAGDFRVEKCLVTYADSVALDSTAIKDHFKYHTFEVQSNVSEKKAVISGTIPAVGKSSKDIRCFYKHSTISSLSPRLKSLWK